MGKILKRSTPDDGKVAIQAFADFAKGLFNFLRDVQEGDDPTESLVHHAKKILKKPAVRKFRGKAPRRLKKKTIDSNE